jgi:hypothetical protein
MLLNSHKKCSSRLGYNPLHWAFVRKRARYPPRRSQGETNPLRTGVQLTNQNLLYIGLGAAAAATVLVIALESNRKRSRARKGKSRSRRR